MVGSQFEFGAFQHARRLYVYGRSKLQCAPRRHGLDPIGGCPREFGVLSLRLRAAGVLTTAVDCCNRPDGGVLQPSCRVVYHLCAPFGAALVCRRGCLLAHEGAASDDPRGRDEYGVGDSNAASRLEPPCVLPDPIAPCAVAAGAAIFGRGNQDLVTVPLPLRVQVPDCSNGNVASITVGLDATFKNEFAVQGRLIIDQPDPAAPIDVYAEVTYSVSSAPPAARKGNVAVIPVSYTREVADVTEQEMPGKPGHRKIGRVLSVRPEV